MKNNRLAMLRHKIDKGLFPNKFEEFGGAKLIITSDPNRRYHDGDTVIFTEHAAALSWLVIQLKGIYSDDIDYLNKYDFYPSIGRFINESLTTQEHLFESMHYVLDCVEEDWGAK